MKRQTQISVYGLLVLLSAAVLFNPSCRSAKEKTSSDPVIHQAVWLEWNVSVIWYEDYLPPGVIHPDSVLIDGKQVQMNKANCYIMYRTPEDAPGVMVMSIFTGDKRIDVPLKKSEKERIVYSFDPGDKRYSSVSLKGEFNGWTPSATPLELFEGKWQAVMILPKGSYQYLVVADGKEMLDPGCERKVDNNIGGFNSLLSIGNQDHEKMPALITDDFSGKKVHMRVANGPVKVTAFLNNRALPDHRIRVDEDRITIEIPDKASKMERSYLRVYAWNDHGFANDLLIPLQDGKVVTNPDKLTRHDLHTAIMYNVFVDRFYNGDPSNDKHLPDSIVHPRANYHGGDIAGVLKKVEQGYFEELGVNTLWLSPVVQNVDGPYGYWPDPPTKFSSYHGYWPTSFTQIDTHFGRPADLRMLVAEAHRSGINILLDFVANHVHQDHPYYKADSTIATALRLPDGTLNLERWDEHRLTTWFDVFLPTLDLEREDVARTVSDSTVWWVTEYQIDGFRHDAAKHIPLTFWRMLTKKLREQVVYPENRPVFQMGETYGGVELIGSYLGSGLLDAQFDFNVYDAALGVFAGGQSFDLLGQRLRQSLAYYGAHNLMGYITGNQDRGRFISYAGGDLRFEENAKAAGWSREIGVGDPVGYDKLNMLMAFNMTIPGVPVIYYGDEFGMAGGNDPDCRRMMRFGSELNHYEDKNLEVTKRLTLLRKQNMALMYGDFSYWQQHPSSLIYARTYFGNTVIAVFNNSKESVEIDLDIKSFAPGVSFRTNLGGTLSTSGDQLKIALKPYSFEVLTMNK
jgi:cyclomaltodextrinase / maltogenic alpha-amylase / neopullulanase